MRLAMLGMASAILVGCEDTRMIDVCTEIARAASVDPSTVSINGTQVTRAALNEDDISRIRAQEWPEGAPPALDELLTVLRASEDYDPSHTFVVVDYTEGQAAYRRRGKTLCRYVDYLGGRVQLFSVTIQDRDLTGMDLGMALDTMGYPPGLDIMRRLE